MQFVIEIVGADSRNEVLVTITKIGCRAAIDTCYLNEPSEGEIEAVEKGIATVLRMQYGAEAIMVTNARMDDPQERQVATRKFLGGGQG